MICPISNTDFDEKMAAELGICREQSTYENTECKLAMALRLLEDKPPRISKHKITKIKKKVGFVNNPINMEVRRATSEVKKVTHGCMPRVLPAIKTEPMEIPPLPLPPPAPHRSTSTSTVQPTTSATSQRRGVSAGGEQSSENHQEEE